MFLNRRGRLELVRSTLSAMAIFAMMFLDISAKTLSYIAKIVREFLWKGPKRCPGRPLSCGVGRVCMPREQGGLGIPNLQLMNHALRARWLWLRRVDTSKPWK